jgi:solute carrier family 25 folate transporter 32
MSHPPKSDTEAFDMMNHISAPAVAGFVAGFTSSATLYPLEVIKSRFQMGKHANFSYSNTFEGLRSAYISGGFRELYRGFPAGLVGSTLSWGAYFWLYEGLKKEVASYRGFAQPGPIDHWASSIVSSSIVQTLLCPLWVVKLNQQLGNADKFWPAARSLYRSEGMGGLYRGLIPGYWSCGHLAIQFVLYEEMKRRVIDLTPYTTINTVAATVVSKSFATILTSPIEVVKVRLRSSSVSRTQTIRSICSEIWSKEGYRGFYKGVGTALIRILPGQCVTFVTYESVMKLLSNR